LKYSRIIPLYYVEREDDDIIYQSSWQDAYGKPWYSNSSFNKNTPHDNFDIQRALNGWRDDLSEDEVHLVEHVCGKMMAYFHYELSLTNADLNSSGKLFFQDQKIEKYFANWKETGVGIEEFPADPLDKSTWEKG